MSQTTSKVRLGVIGAGWFASRRHIPDCLKTPTLTLAAISRRDAEARQKLADHFGLTPEQTFADWREMLESVELDAVLIATPHALHYEQARAALAKGLHVLVEKPMALTTREAWDLVDFAANRERLISTAVNPPFWAHCHAIRDAFRDGSLGDLETATMYWTGSASALFGRSPLPDSMSGVVRPSLYRADVELNGGGYFIDGGSHLLSQLLWVTDLKVRRASAIMDTLPADSRTVVCFEMENGAVVSLTSIGDSESSERRVNHIFGATKGVATVRDFDFKTTIQVEGREAQSFTEADLPPVSTPVANFADAILGRDSLYSAPAHGAYVAQVMEAIYESARTGKTATLSE